MASFWQDRHITVVRRAGKAKETSKIIVSEAHTSTIALASSQSADAGTDEEDEGLSDLDDVDEPEEQEDDFDEPVNFLIPALNIILILYHISILQVPTSHKDTTSVSPIRTLDNVRDDNDGALYFIKYGFCCSMSCSLADDFYYDGPSDVRQPTPGPPVYNENIAHSLEGPVTMGTMETQNDAAPSVLTDAAPQDPDPTSGAVPSSASMEVPHAPIIGPSGRPQRRSNQSRFNLDELRKCTCDVNAEMHPEGGIIQCKNTTCVTKWVCTVN